MDGMGMRSGWTTNLCNQQWRLDVHFLAPCAQCSKTKRQNKPTQNPSVTSSNFNHNFYYATVKKQLILISNTILFYQSLFIFNNKKIQDFLVLKQFVFNNQKLLKYIILSFETKSALIRVWFSNMVTVGANQPKTPLIRIYLGRCVRIISLCTLSN